MFAYRYFRDFGLGAEIREGLISQFCWCFHYYKQTYIEEEISVRFWLTSENNSLYSITQMSIHMMFVLCRSFLYSIMLPLYHIHCYTFVVCVKWWYAICHTLLVNFCDKLCVSVDWKHYHNLKGDWSFPKHSCRLGEWKIMENDFRNPSAKVWANLDNPIKSYAFSKFWLISCLPPSRVALC